MQDLLLTVMFASDFGMLKLWGTKLVDRSKSTQNTLSLNTLAVEPCCSTNPQAQDAQGEGSVHCNGMSDNKCTRFSSSAKQLQQVEFIWHRQASGDMRLLNPVALVENHPACRKNERGHAVLPNQQVWKPHLILLLLSSKLLAETDALLKIQQDSSAGDAQRRAMRMLLAGRKMPPIPYLIASFIQKKSVSVISALQPVCSNSSSGSLLLLEYAKATDFGFATS